MDINEIEQDLEVVEAAIDPASPAHNAIQQIASVLGGEQNGMLSDNVTVKQPVKIGPFKFNINLTANLWWDLNSGKNGLKITGVTFG